MVMRLYVLRGAADGDELSKTIDVIVGQRRFDISQRRNVGMTVQPPPMSLEEFRRESARLCFGNKGLLADCYGPERSWDQTRLRLHEMIVHAAGYRQTFRLEMSAKMTGYLLWLSRWPFVVEIPDCPDVSKHPSASLRPQMMCRVPRNDDECAFVYGLMDACQLVLQMSEPTGLARVVPHSVQLEVLFAAHPRQGEGSASRHPLDCYVRVEGAADLKAFLKAPKTWPRLGQAA